MGFKGPWKAPFGKALEYWVDYTSVKINGKEILSGVIPTWHDEPFVYTINAKKGEEYIIDVKWKNHIQKESDEK